MVRDVEIISKFTKRNILVLLINFIMSVCLFLLVFFKLQKYDYWPKIDTNYDQFYDADSNFWIHDIEKDFFGYFSLLHPFRNLLLFPLSFLSDLLPAKILMILFSIVGLIFFQIFTFNSNPSFRKLFSDSQFLLFIPFFSCSAIIWTLVPESFLISGILIYIGVLFSAKAIEGKKVILSGLLCSSLNILGLVPWIVVILRNKSFSILRRLSYSSSVLAITMVWIFAGKRLYGDEERLSGGKIGSSDFLPKFLESNSKMQFLHPPNSYMAHAFSGFLTGPWSVAFGNSDPSIFIHPLLMLMAVVLTIFSFSGLFRGVRNKSIVISLTCQALLSFELFMLFIFFTYGKVSDPILFMPLIMPGRFYGLFIFLNQATLRMRGTILVSVYFLTLLTVFSNIFM